MIHIFPNKILWLVSYPKSGNTWFRSFLSALINGGPININALKTRGIFSDRNYFDYVTEIESRDLYDDEVKTMIADVYRFMASESPQLNIIKVHDAFMKDIEGNDIIPADVTHCAIYLIRNPLDIAASLANHIHSDIETAVDLMNRKNATLAKQEGNLNRNPQFRQYMYDWSGHVDSWTTLPSFPVSVIRYEDMLSSPFDTFQKAVRFVGWECTCEQIAAAIEAASFDNLSKQEAENGFNEKNHKSQVFFRAGKMGNWKNELPPGLVAAIIEKHSDVMKRYGYLPPDENENPAHNTH